jgi:hypothetical protein
MYVQRAFAFRADTFRAIKGDRRYPVGAGLKYNAVGLSETTFFLSGVNHVLSPLRLSLILLGICDIFLKASLIGPFIKF